MKQKIIKIIKTYAKKEKVDFNKLGISINMDDMGGVIYMHYPGGTMELGEFESFDEFLEGKIETYDAEWYLKQRNQLKESD